MTDPTLEHTEMTEEEFEAEALIDSEQRAEDHLRRRAYWAEQRQEKIAHAALEIAKVEAWRDTQTEKIDRHITWHDTGLKAFMWNSGAKTISLVQGTLKRIKGREKVEIIDEEKFLEMAPEQLVRIKRSPDKREILAQIKAGGEIPEGVDLVTGEDSFSVSQ